MKPTREQVELAAKAAGLILNFTEEGLVFAHKKDCPVGDTVTREWLPATNKSDSFDLMVACKIAPKIFDSIVIAQTLFFAKHQAKTEAWFSDHNNDKSRATMWAIFLCAVEIGRAM